VPETLFECLGDTEELALELDLEPLIQSNFGEVLNPLDVRAFPLCLFAASP